MPDCHFFRRPNQQRMEYEAIQAPDTSLDTVHEKTARRRTCDPLILINLGYNVSLPLLKVIFSLYTFADEVLNREPEIERIPVSFLTLGIVIPLATLFVLSEAICHHAQNKTSNKVDAATKTPNAALFVKKRIRPHQLLFALVHYASDMLEDMAFLLAILSLTKDHVSLSLPLRLGFYGGMTLYSGVGRLQSFKNTIIAFESVNGHVDPERIRNTV